MNPNEYVRKQFRDELKGEDEEYDIESFYRIMDDLKENNYEQYKYVVKIMYADTFSYFNYLKNSNEINTRFYKIYDSLFVTGDENIIKLYEENEEMFVDNFLYLCDMNRLFKIKLYFELGNKNSKLRKKCDIHIYDEVSINEELGVKSLEKFYYECNEDKPIEEIVLETCDFLEYLYNYRRDIYKLYLKDILKKEYKFFIYYLDYSLEVSEDDLEIRLFKIISLNKFDKVCNILKNDKQLMTLLLTRFYDDIELGYPCILTNNGYKIVDDEILNEYVKKLK